MEMPILTPHQRRVAKRNETIINLYEQLKSQNGGIAPKGRGIYIARELKVKVSITNTILRKYEASRANSESGSNS